MDKVFLRTLKELQSKLRDAESLTEDDRRFIEELHREIDDLLARSQKGQSLEHHSLRAQLDAAAKRFEVTHPNLTAVIGSVVDSLSAMGI
jgi:hypothetical protein